MPLMQDYEVEVEIIVRVRNTSHSVCSQNGTECVMDYRTAAARVADSYTPSKSIPAVVTQCIDEVHKKAATVARFTRDSESTRLR